MMKLFASCLLLPALALAEPAWQAAPAGPATWDNALLAASDPMSVRIREWPTMTSLRGYLNHDATGPAAAELTIEWDGIDPGAECSRSTAPGMVQSVTRAGEVTITRTVVVTKDAVVLHFLASKPGSLSFKASVKTPAGPEAKVVDRRFLVIQPPGVRDISTTVTVWPFESDVTPSETSIAVRGEGEALVIWAIHQTHHDEPMGPDAWAGLVKRFDPDGSPPDVSKIWHGLYEERAGKSAPPP